MADLTSSGHGPVELFLPEQQIGATDDPSANLLDEVYALRHQSVMAMQLRMPDTAMTKLGVGTPDDFYSRQSIELREVSQGKGAAEVFRLPARQGDGQNVSEDEGIMAMSRVLHDTRNLTNSSLSNQKIHALFESLSDDNREKLRTTFNKMFGKSLDDHLRSRMSGADLEKALNLLHHKTSKSDDAGFVHQSLTELHQWIYGRSRTAIAKALRDKFSAMTSSDVADAEKDHVARYGKSMQSVLMNDSRIRRETKQCLQIYFKGLDKRTDADSLQLADIAVRAADLDMFAESMRGASESARASFKANSGDAKLRRAFGGHYYTLGIFGNFTDNQLRHAQEYADKGKLGIAMQVRDNTSWMGNNKEALEGALSAMTQQERDSYKRGKASFEGRGVPKDSNEWRDVNYYLQLKSALDKAGNKTKVLRWEDMISVSGGTLVAKLSDHAGKVGLTNDSTGTILGSIENMNSRDWELLKADPEYKTSIQRMLETFLGKTDVARCMELVEKKAAAKDFVDATLAGRRTVSAAIGDNVHWYRNNRRNMLDAILHMTPGEREAYRTNREFQRKVDLEVENNIGKSGPYAKAARFALDQISNEQRLNSSDIVAKLYERAAHWSKDRIGAIRDVEQSFKDDPSLRLRIKTPENKHDARLSAAFKDALKSVLGSHYSTLGTKLIDDGAVAARDRIFFDKGYVYNDRKGMFQDLLNATSEERKLLLSNDSSDKAAAQLQREILHPFNERQRQVALSVLRQGHMEPEDRIRAFAVSLGGDKDSLLRTLFEMPSDRKQRMIVNYAVKYSGNCIGDFMSAVPHADRHKAELFMSLGNESSGQLLNQIIDHHSKSRDGIGKALVDSMWDGTGYQADQALNDYIAAISLSKNSVESLTAAREKELIKNISDRLTAFQQSKAKMAESMANTAISIAAIAGAVFTGGSSLCLLAKAGIAGSIGAAMKVTAKAAIEGSDYEWTGRQLLHDTGTGFVFAASAFIGPQEIGRVLHVGEKAGNQAASMAAASLTKLSQQTGMQVLKEGAAETVQKGMTEMVRNAILSGSMEVPQKAIVALAEKVAVQGNEQAVRMALQMSLASAIKEQSTHVLANIVTEYALPAASGVIAGAGAGTVSGAVNWDTDRSPGENLRNVARLAAEGAVFGGASALVTMIAIKGLAAVYNAGKDAALGLFSKRVVDADRYLNANIDKVAKYSEKPVKYQAALATEPSVLMTSEGAVTVKSGDWILKTATGETRVVDALTFTREYVTVAGAGGTVQHKLLESNALRLTADVSLKAADGSAVQGKVGDWLVVSQNGRQDIVPNHLFVRMFDGGDAAAKHVLKTAQQAALAQLAPQLAAREGLGDIEQFWIKPTEVKAHFHQARGSETAHWLVDDGVGHTIKLSDEIFHSLFDGVSGKANNFVSKTTVLEAARLTKPMTLTGPGGSIESGKIGDWLIATSNGEKHILPAAQFGNRFEYLGGANLPTWIQTGSLADQHQAVHSLFERAKDELKRLNSARGDVARTQSAMKARNYYELAIAAASDPHVNYPLAVRAEEITQLARLTAQQGRFEEAARLYDLIVHPGAGRFGSLPTAKELISVYEQAGKISEAETLHRQAAASLLLERGRSDRMYLQQLDELGDFLRRHKLYDKADEVYRQALAIREGSSQTSPRYNKAVSLQQLAQLYDERGMPREAERFYIAALEHSRKTMPANDERILSGLDALANWYQRHNRLPDAESAAREALLFRASQLPPPLDAVARRLPLIADLQIQQAKFAEATLTLYEAVYTQYASGGPYSKEMSQILATLERVAKRQSNAAVKANLRRLVVLAAEDRSYFTESLNRMAGRPTPEYDELVDGIAEIINEHKKNPKKLIELKD